MSQPTSASSEPKVDPVSGLSGDELSALLKSILIIIPYRGSEGVCPGLEDKVAYWKGCGILVDKLEDQMGGFIQLQRAIIARRFLELCRDSRPEPAQTDHRYRDGS